MGSWGIFKKIANAVKKAVKWTGSHIIKPVINTAKKVINSDVTKKLVNAGIKLAPVIGGAIGASQGNPQAGLTIGNTIQGIGNSLGFGR